MPINLKRVLTVAGAAAAIVGLSTATASAAAGWTVTAGSTTTGTAQLSGVASGTPASPSVVFKNVISGATVICASSTNSGSANLGTGLPAANLLLFTGSSYSNCMFVNTNYQANINQTTSPWRFNGLSYTAPTTSALVTNIGLSFAAVGGPCSFSLNGATEASYTNGTDLLSYATASNFLVVSGVAGTCFGQWHNTDKVAFLTPHPYKITTNLGPLTVTSP